MICCTLVIRFCFRTKCIQLPVDFDIWWTFDDFRSCHRFLCFQKTKLLFFFLTQHSILHFNCFNFAIPLFTWPLKIYWFCLLLLFISMLQTINCRNKMFPVGFSTVSHCIICLLTYIHVILLLSLSASSLYNFPTFWLIYMFCFTEALSVCSANFAVCVVFVLCLVLLFVFVKKKKLSDKPSFKKLCASHIHANNHSNLPCWYS